MGICSVVGGAVEQPVNLITASTDALMGVELIHIGIVFIGTYTLYNRKETSKRLPKLSDLFFGIALVFLALMSFAGAKDHSLSSRAEARPYWLLVVIFGVIGGLFFAWGTVADYCLTWKRFLFGHFLVPLLPCVVMFLFLPACNWTFIAYSISQLPAIAIAIVYTVLSIYHSRWTPLTTGFVLIGILCGVVIQAVGSMLKWQLWIWHDFDYNVVFHLWQMVLFALFYIARLTPPVRNEHKHHIPNWGLVKLVENRMAARFAE